MASLQVQRVRLKLVIYGRFMGEELSLGFPEQQGFPDSKENKKVPITNAK